MAGEEGQGQEGRDQPVWQDHDLHVVWGITLMSVLGIASVSPAFPEVEQAFSLSSGQVYLLISVFALPGVFLTFVAGILSDRYGRRKVVVPSLFLFGIAGAACAFAPNFGVFLALRFLQGIGAAGLAAPNYAIIGDLYVGRERTTAFGYNSSVLSISAASFPAIGGALALLGWSYPFLLPLLAIPIGFLVLYSLRKAEPHNRENLREHLGVVLKRLKNPRDLGLFACSLVTFVVLFGTLQGYLPTLMNQNFGASSLLTGVVLASLSITAALTSTQMGRLSSRFSEQNLIRASFVLYAVALCLIPLVPVVWLLFVPMLVFGVAQSLNVPNVYSLINQDAPDEEHRGAFISLNSTTLRLGQLIGPLLMAAAQPLLGIGGAYFAAAALVGAMFFVAYFFIR